jgi:hypothetical protein
MQLTTLISPVPFSLASNSSKSLKFRGIIIGAAIFENARKAGDYTEQRGHESSNYKLLRLVTDDSIMPSTVYYSRS